MAEHAADTVTSAGAVAGTSAASAVPHGGAAHSEHNSGRPISWVGTILTIVGFVIGGVAFPISSSGPNWIVFWVGSAVALVGLFILLFSKTMSTDWY